MGEEIPPSQVLYVNNLNDKLHIENILKRQLYRLFSQYGKINEVIAFKGLKGKGQAWIVYQDVNSAATALRSKQGFNFYDKPIKIAFAKIKPNSVALSQKISEGKVKTESQKSDKKRKVDHDTEQGPVTKKEKA